MARRLRGGEDGRITTMPATLAHDIALAALTRQCELMRRRDTVRQHERIMVAAAAQALTSYVARALPDDVVAQGLVGHVEGALADEIELPEMNR